MSDEPSDELPGLLPAPAPASPPASPFAPQEEPRLSLKHLLVWAACIGVYCSARQAGASTIGSDITGYGAVFWACELVAGGTGLAGLVVAVARWRQGMSFPRHGGEVLWLLSGVRAAIEGGYAVLLALGLFGWAERLGIVLLIGVFAIWPAIYIYFIILCKERRWRWFLVVAAVLIFLPILGRELVVLVLLGTIAAIDARRPVRYSWPHWVGVFLWLFESLYQAIALSVVLAGFETIFTSHGWL